MLQKVLFAIYILAVLTISATADAQTDSQADTDPAPGLGWLTK